ncbi:hypothetical protein D3C76_1180260 [compost metagenome]
MGIDVMWVDLYREQPQRRQHDAVAHRHIVGGTDARRRHVAASAPTHIRYFALTHRTLDWHYQAIFMQHLVQHPGIAAADQNTLGLCDRLCRRLGMVDAGNLDTQRLRQFPRTLVVITADHGIRNKYG